MTIGQVVRHPTLPLCIQRLNVVGWYRGKTRALQSNVRKNGHELREHHREGHVGSRVVLKGKRLVWENATKVLKCGEWVFTHPLREALLSGRCTQRRCGARPSAGRLSLRSGTADFTVKRRGGGGRGGAKALHVATQ